MPKPLTKGTFLAKLRMLAAGERGNAAFITIAAVMVISILGGSVAAALGVAMNVSADMKANNSIASAVSSAAQRDAAKGFQAAAALPAIATVQIPLGGTTVPAKRTVVIDSAKQKADITYSAGRYVKGKYASLNGCTTTPGSCLTATSVAAPSLALTVPYVDGVTVADPTANLSVDGATRWQSVAAGSNHMLGVDQQGTLWGWGSGGTGQLGTEDAVTQPLPVKVKSDVAWSRVAASGDTSFGLDVTGVLWAWGSNAGKIRGDDETANVNTPQQVLEGRTFTSVKTSDKLACALTQIGEAFCWGAGLAPTQVGTDTYTQIAPGDAKVLLRDKSGVVYTWDLGGTPVAVEMDSAIAQIAAGPASFYAVDSFGRLNAWGKNNNGQLGDGTKTDRATPVRIAAGLRFKTIEANATSAYGITRDSTVYGWGANTAGQLGTGDKAEKLVPQLVSSAASFLSVVTGAGKTVAALDSGHRLWMWGTGTNGAVFGDGGTAKERLTARQMDMSPPTVAQVAAGRAHTVVIDDDGRAYAWGANNYGQLGTGDTGEEDQSQEAIAKYGDASIVQVSANGTGTITALTTTGILVSSGNNDRGQLGDGTNTSSSTPVRTGDGRYSKVDLGTGFGLAIGRDDGKVYSWGDNSYGQLGDGTTTNRNTLATVKGIPDGTRIVDVAAGNLHGAGLDSEGQVWTWGRNYYGQLGDGSTTDRRTAEVVPIPTRVAYIAAGIEFMLAVDVNGDLWAWGRNNAGQIGIGATGDNVVIPTKIETPAPLAQVAAGRSNGTAITRDGQLLSWGGADNVDISGHGNRTTLVPTAIAEVAERKFIAVNGGGENSIAVDAAGEIYMWGPSAGALALTLDQYDDESELPVEETESTEEPTEDETTPDEETDAPDTGGDGCITTPIETTDPNDPAETTEPTDPSPEPTETTAPGDEEADEGAEDLPIDEEAPEENTDCTNDEADTGVVDEETPEEAEESEGIHLDNMIVAADVHNTNLVIVDGSGNVVVTGDGKYGQLGDGTTVDWSTAITEVTAWRAAADAVDDLSGKAVRFTDLAAGGDVSTAVDTNGFLWTWGDNSTGQLGAGPSLERVDAPALAWTASRFTSVSTGGNSSAAIDNVGQAWVWGRGGVVAPVSSSTAWVPTRVPSAPNYSKIAVSSDHAVAVSSKDGEVYGWGANSSGQVLAGGPATVLAPTSTTAVSVVDVAAGEGFSVALYESGVAFAWGSRNGVIGGTSKFTQVSASGGAASAVRTDGHVIGWTAATGATTDQDASRFTRTDIGDQHTVAVDAEGRVWAWGDDAEGQLGRDGDAASPNVVRQIGTERLFQRDTPVVDTSVWKVGRVTGAVSGIIQLNVDTPLPIDAIGIWCESTKSRVAVAPVRLSSGTYVYGNVDTASTDGCGDRYFAVFVNGQAVTTSEVQAVLLPVQRTGIEVG